MIFGLFLILHVFLLKYSQKLPVYDESERIHDNKLKKPRNGIRGF